MKLAQDYILEAKKELSESKITDKDIQKMLFDLVKLVQENPNMKDSEVKKLVNGIQKLWLQNEIDKK
jgi:hypothetical protein